MSHTIYKNEFITFLQTNEPRMYAKLKDSTNSELIKMKSSKPLLNSLSKFCLHHKYFHGDVIIFMDEGNRNDGVLFWDAMKEKVIPPSFYDYAGIPETFIVGDGFFSPNHWTRSFDDYYSVRPCKALIKEMKAFFTKTPTGHMSVSINGNTFTIYMDAVSVNQFEWKKVLLNLWPDAAPALSITPDVKSEGKALNEDNLKKFFKGETVRQNHTRKLSLQAKLVLAEAKLVLAKKEVDDIRRALEIIGGKKKTEKNYV